MTETEAMNLAPQSPVTLAAPYPLMPGESADILVDVANLIPNAEQWLDAPNSHFALQTPRSLIGTEQEGLLRELLRALQYGLYW